MDDESWGDDALREAPVFVDPRTFQEFELVPGHPSGKDRVFLDLLGFRARSAEDAEGLARSYQVQARDRIQSGAVRFTGINDHGWRFMNVVVVRGVALRSGWLLRRDGALWLTTPFRGFARVAAKE